jgi:hypothetical protein
MPNLPQQSQGLTTKLPQNQKQDFLELRLCAVAKATLGRGAFWVLFCRKKVPEEFT